MSSFIIAISLISGFIYVFGLFSLFFKEKLFINESIASLVFGVCISPFLHKDNSIKDSEFLIQLSRIVISLQVVAVGITVHKEYVLKEWRSLFVILVPLMICSYGASALIIYFVLGIDFYAALLIAACITPTDPVLATAVLKGRFAIKYIPAHLRNLLTIESGANDGLGFLLLTFPLIFIKTSFRHWFIHVWLYEIFFSIFIGAFIGYIAKKLMIFCKKHQLIDKESFLASMLALCIFVTGITAWLKSDDILACFVCGMFFSWDQSFIHEIKDSHLIEVLDLLFTCVYFIYFGSIISYQKFKYIYVLISILILLFRRIPFFFLFKKVIPQLKNNKEVLFAGWFGPVGVGGVFFAHHAWNEVKDTALNGKEDIIYLVEAIVISSIFVHGITAPITYTQMKKKTIFKNDESEYAESNENNMI
ncbi:Na+/H+ antiporter [Gurleya vavrai]